MSAADPSVEQLFSEQPLRLLMNHSIDIQARREYYFHDIRRARGNNQMTRFTWSWTTALITAFFFSLPHLAASSVTFTTLAGYNSATTTTIGFDGILTGGSTFAGFNPLMVSGVTFATPNIGTLGLDLLLTFTATEPPRMFHGLLINSLLTTHGYA
jgi:hypothetical protein